VSTLKIVVDWDLCESNGLCVEAAPKVFALGDDDTLIVHTEHTTAEELENVRTAVRRCPKAAIKLVEE
jgi:ferredoxin